MWWRLFAILRLTPEQLTKEEHWHALFRQKVGTHTDYHETGVRHRGELHPRKEWRDFYAAHASRKPMNLHNNEVLAWFEERR